MFVMRFWTEARPRKINLWTENLINDVYVS